jgi:oxygen-dependent protoporphyrinogen oxidase
VNVLVLGGGISGLAGAWELTQLGHEVTLIEQEEQLGGKLQTRVIDGIQVELGPDSYLRRNPAANELIGRLELDEVVPAAGKALLYTEMGAQPIPNGLNLGAPKSPSQALHNHLVPFGSRLRAAIGMRGPSHDTTGEGDDLGTIVTRRYGRRWSDTNIEPLVGGINANTIYGLSASTSAPSIIAPTTPATGQPTQPQGPIFAAPSTGLSTLVTKLRQELESRGCHFVTSSPVQTVERTRPSNVIVTTATESYTADRVLIAVPAFQAAAMLDPILGEGIELLKSIHYASVSMSIVLTDGPIPDRLREISGVLVARNLGLMTTAVSIASNKWPTTLPNDASLLRISTGSLYDRRHLRINDDELESTLMIESQRILDWNFLPTWHRVVRWPRAFPHFRPYHRLLIAKLDACLNDQFHGDIAVTGSYINGSGIPTCIASARERSGWLTQ